MGLLTRDKVLRSATSPSAENPNLCIPELERIDTLLAERAAARANKNWKESDRLRDDLAAMGVAIEDKQDLRRDFQEFKR